MTRIRVLLAAVVVATSGGAMAQGAPSPEPPGREAIFKSPGGSGRLKPLGPYWPERALRTGIGGHVAMDCLVDDANRVTGCKIVDEAPADFDFGSAVLLMVRRGLVTGAPLPEGGAAPADHIWRFRIVLPARSL